LYQKITCAFVSVTVVVVAGVVAVGMVTNERYES